MISDCAFDQLMAIYEQDRILWAAVYAMHQAYGIERPLRALAQVHGIDPDQE